MERDVMKSPRARAAVRLALDEDLASVDRVKASPWCDATSLALVDSEAVAEGEIYAKGKGCVVAGATVARAVLKAVDPKISVKILKKDGTATTSITTVTSQTIQLTAEVAPGTALNTSVSWSSSNENIATVNANGLVTTKTTAGTVNIRATCNGNTSVYRECTVEVRLPVISVQYREYNTSTKQFTTKTANVLPITGDMTTLNNTGISNGWYAVTGDVTISTRITVSGTVNLILCDSATLEATKGINVKSGDTLNIYAQSEGSNQGVLMASGDSPKAGIGGGASESGGNITIHGGTVMAQGGGWFDEEEEAGEGGAGIGGGANGTDGNITGGNITIHGGTVMAQGGPFGSGIGGGLMGSGGNITINGGNITAVSGFYASSIGGGAGKDGGTITINGGTVTANSTDGYGDAGIGGGFTGSGGNITINGGTVTAQGGECASGIGGGCYGNGGTVTIKGGTVTANGGEYGGAGIGGGAEGNGANVTVYGGTVTATGNDANGISCGGKYNDVTDSFDTDSFNIGKLTIIGNLRVYSDYNCTQQNTNYPTNRTNPMVIK